MTPIGSVGDVFPFIGLGRALRRRGHEVTVVTVIGEYAEYSRKADLNAIQLAPDEVTTRIQEACAVRTNIEEALSYLIKEHWKELAPFVLDRMYEIIEAHNVPGDTVIAAATGALGAYAAHIKLCIPLATICQLSANLQLFQPIATWMPSALDGHLKSLLLTWFTPVGRCVKDVRAFSSALRIPSAESFYHTWFASHDTLIGLFPAWLVPSRMQSLDNCVMDDFPLYDAADTENVSPDLAEFVECEGPPIAFYNSSWRASREFFVTSIEVCKRLKVRGVMISNFPNAIPSGLPADIHQCEYAPFSWLLPRCAAIVHHAGLGTVAQSLRAGIPQLLVPDGSEQSFNAQCAERLGVGSTLNARSYNSSNATRALTQILHEPKYRDSCRDAAARFEEHRQLDEACTALESLVNASAR